MSNFPERTLVVDYCMTCGAPSPQGGHHGGLACKRVEHERALVRDGWCPLPKTQRFSEHSLRAARCDVRVELPQLQFGGSVHCATHWARPVAMLLYLTHDLDWSGARGKKVHRAFRAFHEPETALALFAALALLQTDAQAQHPALDIARVTCRLAGLSVRQNWSFGDCDAVVMVAEYEHQEALKDHRANNGHLVYTDAGTVGRKRRW